MHKSMALGALVGTSIVHYLLVLCTYASAIGFTTDLIHRDSPMSPLYDPSLSPYDRVQNAIERSLKRVNDLNRKIEAPLTHGYGEYHMKVSLGTPPVELLGIADTGSDLTWTQCVPCDQCYKQKLPLFNPNSSSSFGTVSCGSDACAPLPVQSCGGDNSTCKYDYEYGDGSYTRGDLATETFIVGGSNEEGGSIKNMVFGCGHASGGIFEENLNGIVGLGGGRLSLVSQMGENGRKFSYCMTLHLNTTSKISFGSDATVTGPGVVTTPMVTESQGYTYYNLTLKSLTVGRREVAFARRRRSIKDDNVEDQGRGNIIIDSGTTLTMVPQDVLSDLILALEEAVKLPRVDDPKGHFQLCFSIAGTSGDTDHHRRRVPDIIAHFEGGDVVLQPMNMYMLVSDTILCLAVVPTDSISIFGNVAQIGFLIGYDLDALTVSFLPNYCVH